MSITDRSGGHAFEDLTARARIRDVALRHFAEYGFTRATIREIALAADVSPGLVRHHFGSKEALRQACDEYALRALNQFNEQALESVHLSDPRISIESRRALEPFQRYMVRALLDESTIAEPMFDEMVKMIDRWLQRADESRADAPAVDRKTRAALMVAQTLGIAAFQKQVSRVTGIDIFSAEGDRQIALAMLDIYSHSLISPEFASSAQAGFDRPPGESSRGNETTSRDQKGREPS